MTDHPEAAPPAVESVSDFMLRIKDYEMTYLAACRELEQREATIREPLEQMIAELEREEVHHFQARTALRNDLDAALERAQRLAAALREIAESYDCETDGCSAENPLCVGSTALAALAAHRDDRAEDGGGQ